MSRLVSFLLQILKVVRVTCKVSSMVIGSKCFAFQGTMRLSNLSRVMLYLKKNLKNSLAAAPSASRYITWVTQHSSIYLHTFQNANAFALHAALEITRLIVKFKAKTIQNSERCAVTLQAQSSHMQGKVTPTNSYPRFHSYLPLNRLST